MELFQKQQIVSRHVDDGDNGRHTASPQKRSRVRNILIVDNNEYFLSALKDWINTLGADYSVLTATNGMEGIAIVQSVPVDVLLSDLRMPEIDGYKLLSYVRRHYPHILTFAMTGAYNNEARDRLLALGITDCFEKPLDFEEVKSKIMR